MGDRAAVSLGHDELETLGKKLDRFAEELDDNERYFLGALLESAAQKVSGDVDASFASRLHRVQGRLDTGAFSVII